MNPAQAITFLLARPGWTEVRIANAAGTTQPTINRIKRGSTPSYQVGVRLVALAESQETAGPAPSEPDREVA